jgi:FMNH2-dependent dimethyl sulfone monooxygenase
VRRRELAPLRAQPRLRGEAQTGAYTRGGNSTAARFNGRRCADWHFSNGKDFAGLIEQWIDVRDHARCGAASCSSCFIIAGNKEKEAKETVREIIAKANKPARSHLGP